MGEKVRTIARMQRNGENARKWKERMKMERMHESGKSAWTAANMQSRNCGRAWVIERM